MQSISAELHNGRVKLTMRKDSRKGSKAVEAVSNAGLNTGQWRKVWLEEFFFYGNVLDVIHHENIAAIVQALLR